MRKFSILIVEDDDYKKEALNREIRTVSDTISIMNVMSVQKGIEQLHKQKFHLIILDMALPSHDIEHSSASPLTLLDGGVEVLHELSYLDRADPILIVTQYPDVPYEDQIIGLEQFRKSISSQLKLNIMNACHFEKNASKWKLVVKSTVRDLYEQYSAD